MATLSTALMHASHMARFGEPCEYRSQRSGQVYACHAVRGRRMETVGEAGAYEQLYTVSVSVAAIPEPEQGDVIVVGGTWITVDRWTPSDDGQTYDFECFS